MGNLDRNSLERILKQKQDRSVEFRQDRYLIFDSLSAAMKYSRSFLCLPNETPESEFEFVFEQGISEETATKKLSQLHHRLVYRVSEFPQVHLRSLADIIKDREFVFPVL